MSLILLLLTTTLLGPAVAGHNSVAPALTCADPVYYVGTTQAERRFSVDHAFRIANRASTPSRILSVEPACGCSKQGRRAYDIRFPASVPAGSEVNVKIGFPTAPVAGVPDIRQFTLRSDRAGASDLGLTVLAKRLGGLDLFPGTDILLRPGGDGKAATTLYLVSDDFADLEVAPREPLESGLAVVVERITESSKIHLPASVWSSGSVWVIRVEVDSKSGTTFRRVVLKTNRRARSEVSLHLSIF